MPAKLWVWPSSLWHGSHVPTALLSRALERHRARASVGSRAGVGKAQPRGHVLVPSSVYKGQPYPSPLPSVRSPTFIVRSVIGWSQPVFHPGTLAASETMCYNSRALRACQVCRALPRRGWIARERFPPAGFGSSAPLLGFQPPAATTPGLPSPECRAAATGRRVASLDWRLSLSNTHRRSPRLSVAWWLISVRHVTIRVVQVAHACPFSGERHPACFQFGAMMSKAAVDVCGFWLWCGRACSKQSGPCAERHSDSVSTCVWAPPR